MQGRQVPESAPAPGAGTLSCSPPIPQPLFPPQTNTTDSTVDGCASSAQPRRTGRGPYADDDLPEGPLLPQVLAARREVRRAQERAEELEAQLLREFNSWAPTPVEALCLVCGRLSTTAGEEAQHRARHRKDAVTQGRDSLVVAHVAVGDEGLRHVRELCLQWQAERPQARPAQGGPHQGFPFAAPGPFGAPIQPALQAGLAAPHPAPEGAEQGDGAAVERDRSMDSACDRVLFGSASNRSASSPAPRDGSLPPPASRPRALSLPGDAGEEAVPAGPGGADQAVPAAPCGEGDPVGPAAPHREAAPDAAAAAHDVAGQAGPLDAIRGADQVEPAGAPAERADDRAADAQIGERRLRRERRRFRHAADPVAPGEVAEPFPNSDESDSDSESGPDPSGDGGGRDGHGDGDDESGPDSGNGGPGGSRPQAGQPASEAPDASAEPGLPEAPSEAGLGNGSAANDRSGRAATPAEASPGEGGFLPPVAEAGPARNGPSPGAEPGASGAGLAPGDKRPASRSPVDTPAARRRKQPHSADDPLAGWETPPSGLTWGIPPEASSPTGGSAWEGAQLPCPSPPAPGPGGPLGTATPAAWTAGDAHTPAGAAGSPDPRPPVSQACQDLLNAVCGTPGTPAKRPASRSPVGTPASVRRKPLAGMGRGRGLGIAAAARALAARLAVGRRSPPGPAPASAGRGRGTAARRSPPASSSASLTPVLFPDSVRAAHAPVPPHTHVSLGRGGDDPCDDGDVQRHPGPLPGGPSGGCSSATVCVLSRGRGGDDLCVDGDIHPNPGPAVSDAQDPAPTVAEPAPASTGPGAAGRQSAAGSQRAPAPVCICRTTGERRGRHRMWCPCSRAYREAVAGGREPAAVPPRTPVEPSGGAPSAAGRDGQQGGAIPFSFEEVATAGIRTLERVPAAAKPQVSALFETVLRAATDDAGWLRAYAFAPLVLSATHRGGRKAVTEALRRRVRLWRAGQLETLWAEARAVSAGKGDRRARRRAYPVADDADNRLELQTDVESVDDLDGATVRQVLRRARDRCYSRAVSALSAAQTAPADDATLAALRELHPPAPELPDDRSLRPVAVARPSPGVIRRVLKKMPKGTAAGPSGLSAQHLLDLWDVSGSFKEAVADAVWALSSGRVASAARPYLFGARLVPLVKKSGGIRPIACGEILRRVAGKVLASDRAIKDLGANVLLRSGQVGVSVKAGADAGVHAIRRVAALYRDRDVVDRGILQIDFANAFNTLRREAIICSVNRHAPQLLGYALAAYEKHSALVVGDRGISSQCGVQQGDPLGPLLFSLVMHDVVVPPNPGEQPPVPAAPASSQAPVESAPASLGQPEPLDAAGGRPTPPEPAQAPGSGDPAVPPPPPVGSPAAPRATDGALSQAGLDLLTFFLDDGAAGGELDTLGHWLQGFEDRAAAVGLSLNRGKCRLSVAPGATIPEALQGIETFPLDDIQHLGVPCGSPETMRAFVEEAAKSAERKMRMIASLPDAHVALTLLKFCAGFVSVVHLMRAVGAVFDFACIDQATQSCLATITGIETDASAWALASLPVRLGGLGLHSCADTAAIAHIAATFDGEACLPSLVTPYVLPHAMLLDEDDTFLASLEDPRLAPFESVLEKIQNVLQARDNYGGRGQKVWSATVHDERRKALLISMTEELGRSGRLQGSALALKQVQVRARIQSCSAQHASAWLYGNAEADPRLWLSPAELAVAIRLRLGLPIAPMPSICRLCGTGSADVDGVHARSCFSGGRRTRMHNALRDVIADFARRGLLAPAVERPVFSNTERKRPDISYVRDGTTVVLDVAVTFPLQPSNPQYAKRAAEKPGGAATAYATAVKEGKYRGIIDNEPNPREWLAVPLVVDTFGAWCPGALTELRQIARKSALREDRTASAACQDFFHQLSFQVAQGVARIVISSGGARPDEAVHPGAGGSVTASRVFLPGRTCLLAGQPRSQ
ncbi:hypothetical protein DIPPA_14102 [Diplonema papillatum]|nr:hypothetical protein DIPPA_14102 [Diplonema papillatum]